MWCCESRHDAHAYVCTVILHRFAFWHRKDFKYDFAYVCILLWHGCDPWMCIGISYDFFDFCHKLAVPHLQSPGAADSSVAEAFVWNESVHWLLLSWLRTTPLSIICPAIGCWGSIGMGWSGIASISIYGVMSCLAFIPAIGGSVLRHQFTRHQNISIHVPKETAVVAVKLGWTRPLLFHVWNVFIIDH